MYPVNGRIGADGSGYRLSNFEFCLVVLVEDAKDWVDAEVTGDVRSSVFLQNALNRLTDIPK